MDEVVVVDSNHSSFKNTTFDYFHMKNYVAFLKEVYEKK